MNTLPDELNDTLAKHTEHLYSFLRANSAGESDEKIRYIAEVTALAMLQKANHAYTFLLGSEFSPNVEKVKAFISEREKSLREQDSSRFSSIWVRLFPIFEQIEVNLFDPRGTRRRIVESQIQSASKGLISTVYRGPSKTLETEIRLVHREFTARVNEVYTGRRVKGNQSPRNLLVAVLGATCLAFLYIGGEIISHIESHRIVPGVSVGKARLGGNVSAEILTQFGGQERFTYSASGSLDSGSVSFADGTLIKLNDGKSRGGIFAIYLAGQDCVKYRTAEGIGIGSTFSEVAAAFPQGIREENSFEDIEYMWRIGQSTYFSFSEDRVARITIIKPVRDGFGAQNCVYNSKHFAFSTEAEAKWLNKRVVFKRPDLSTRLTHIGDYVAGDPMFAVSREVEFSEVEGRTGIVKYLPHPDGLPFATIEFENGDLLNCVIHDDGSIPGVEII